MKNPMIKVAVKYAKKALGSCKTPKEIMNFDPNRYFEVHFSNFTQDERSEAIALLKGSTFYKNRIA